MDENNKMKVTVVVIGTKEEEETSMKNTIIMEGRREKLRLKVVSMSAWCVWFFCLYLYVMTLNVWDTNLVPAILCAIPFLLAFLVHLLCIYRYLSNKISSFVAVNPQTTRKQIAAIILMNYFPFVNIYMLAYCFVLYHISEKVSTVYELRSFGALAFMHMCASNGMVCGGYDIIEKKLKSYELKQQQSATTFPSSIDQQQHTMTGGGGGGKEKEKLIEMVKHTSNCSVMPALFFLIPLSLILWFTKLQIFRATAVLYLIPVVFVSLVTLIWLRRYAMDCINKSFDEFDPPQSTTTTTREIREWIITGNAKKHFAFTAISFGVHLFVLYMISDEVIRKNYLLKLLLYGGLILFMSYLQILARFVYNRVYIPVKHKSDVDDDSFEMMNISTTTSTTSDQQQQQ